MESYCLKFLIAYSILLTGIEGRIAVSPPSISTIGDNSRMLYRLNQLEAKVEQHEVKINSQQKEIDQLKKKNYDLEEKNHQLTLKNIVKEDYATSHASSLPRSCFELKATNPSAPSGVYLIDPNGQIGVDPPIQVYCDMATQTTSIYHDTEDKTKITSCLDPGCYTKAITYNATVRQLAKLADISASCKQHIRFESTGVPLEYNNARYDFWNDGNNNISFDSFVVTLENNNNTQYGYWNDRNGGKQSFWAGPATTNHTCQCGISKNCIEKNYECNADSLAPIELVDEGFITASELLPVTRLSFGRTSLTGVKASYTLGRFECTGQAAISSKPSNCRDLFKMGHTLNGFYDVDGGSNQISSVYCDFSKSSTETGYETRYGQAPISSKPTSCQDLFKMGHILSGFYNVKSGSNQIASTYCDFSKSSTEAGYETRYGFVDVKSNPVHFFVARTSDWNKTGTMPFEKEFLNLGGGMNLRTGVFMAPKAGIYAFSFKGIGSEHTSYYDGHGSVFLQRNGADVASGFSRIGIKTSTMANLALFVHSTLKLNEGDTITIRLNSGTISSNGNIHIQFTGSLLEEDLVIS